MTKIDHIALYVRDLEGAKAFFATYFDAVTGGRYENPNTGFSSYFLTFDRGSRLELMCLPELDEISADCSVGYAHAAFSVGSRKTVDELTARLAADGYPVLSGPRITGDGYYESCICGFEGILLEITV